MLRTPLREPYTICPAPFFLGGATRPGGELRGTVHEFAMVQKSTVDADLAPTPTFPKGMLDFRTLKTPHNPSMILTSFAEGTSRLAAGFPKI